MQGLWDGVGAVLVVAGHYEANSDMQPTLRVISVTPDAAAAGDGGVAGALEEELAGQLGAWGEAADAAAGPAAVRELSRALSMRPSGPAPGLRREFSKAM